MRCRRFCQPMGALLLILWIGLAAMPACAGERCSVNVTTILAANDYALVDARLKPDIDELQAIFRYTSYRLLSSDPLTLETGQNVSLDLPGEHEISITLQEMKKDRAGLDLHLSRQNTSVFQTRVLLLNQGNLFIGGPKYLNGNLIFKISSAF